MHLQSFISLLKLSLLSGLFIPAFLVFLLFLGLFLLYPEYELVYISEQIYGCIIGGFS